MGDRALVSLPACQEKGVWPFARLVRRSPKGEGGRFRIPAPRHARPSVENSNRQALDLSQLSGSTSSANPAGMVAYLQKCISLAVLLIMAMGSKAGRAAELIATQKEAHNLILKSAYVAAGLDLKFNDVSKWNLAERHLGFEQLSVREFQRAEDFYEIYVREMMKAGLPAFTSAHLGDKLQSEDLVLANAAAFVEAAFHEGSGYVFDAFTRAARLGLAEKFPKLADAEAFLKENYSLNVQAHSHQDVEYRLKLQLRYPREKIIQVNAIAPEQVSHALRPDNDYGFSYPRDFDILVEVFLRKGNRELVREILGRSGIELLPEHKERIANEMLRGKIVPMFSLLNPNTPEFYRKVLDSRISTESRAPLEKELKTFVLQEVQQYAQTPLSGQVSEAAHAAQKRVLSRRLYNYFLLTLPSIGDNPLAGDVKRILDLDISSSLDDALWASLICGWISGHLSSFGDTLTDEETKVAKALEALKETIESAKTLLRAKADIAALIGENHADAYRILGLDPSLLKKYSVKKALVQAAERQRPEALQFMRQKLSSDKCPQLIVQLDRMGLVPNAPQ